MGERTDAAAAVDRRQVQKDIHRTFAGFPVSSSEDALHLGPLLSNVILAYVERGRSLCATSMAIGLSPAERPSLGRCHAATAARGLLTGYVQGLNFLAGMALLVTGTMPCESEGTHPEETAFWLLASLLEDVLDPDFFGTDVLGDQQMAFIGGLGMKALVLEYAKDMRCHAQRCSACGGCEVPVRSLRPCVFSKNQRVKTTSQRVSEVWAQRGLRPMGLRARLELVMRLQRVPVEAVFVCMVKLGRCAWMALPAVFRLKQTLRRW